MGGKFKYGPDEATFDDVMSGKAQVSNRQLLKILKLLSEKLNIDTGAQIITYGEEIEEVLD